MKAKKRDWNGLVKSSKLSQVRESSVLDSYHRNRAASSLVADCTNPQRPPALWSSGGGNSGIEPFGTGGDTHTKNCLSCQELRHVTVLQSYTKHFGFWGIAWSQTPFTSPASCAAFLESTAYRELSEE